MCGGKRKTRQFEHGLAARGLAGVLRALSQPEQPGSKPIRPRGFQNAVAVTASVLWGTEGLDSGYDQPGFGRKQGRPPVVSRAQLTRVTVPVLYLDLGF